MVDPLDFSPPFMTSLHVVQVRAPSPHQFTATGCSGTDPSLLAPDLREQPCRAVHLCESAAPCAPRERSDARTEAREIVRADPQWAVAVQRGAGRASARDRVE